MNQDVFFKNFELLADAPNGVQKLRELILQLAVMGKLVPQDPNDESASILVERIKSEKKKLDKKGKNNGSKQFPEISDNEVLFEVPDSWKWIRFDDICSYIQRGKSPKYVEESEFPVIAQKCIQWDGLKIDRAKFIDPLTIDKYEEERFLRTGDLLWNSTGTGTIGRVNVYVHEENNYEKVVADTHVTVVRPLQSDSYYVFCWIASPMVQSNIENIASGSTNQIELATSTVKNHVVPLPPLAEQKRIVSKVDELMALCDKLEARRQKKQEIQSKLNSAALERMLSAENQEEFEQYWQRICENFDLLYDNPENVEKLKQAILQLAVQGKLVPQNPEDEPASVLVEKIDSERARLVKIGEIKKNKPLPIKFDEIPYDLPETWRWVRIDEVARNVEYGTSEKASEIEDGVPILRMNNVQNGKIVYEDLKYVPESIKDLPRLFLKHNDLLFNRTNSYELVGKTGIFKGEDDTFTLASYLIRVSLFNEYIVPDFINMSLNSSYFRKTQIEPEITQQCGQANFNGTKLKNSLVPFPPLEEQKRIVEKVEQLMGLCDELEAKLRKQREDSEKIMEAAVKGLLEGAVAEKTKLEKPIPLQAAVVKLK